MIKTKHLIRQMDGFLDIMGGKKSPPPLNVICGNSQALVIREDDLKIKNHLRQVFF